MMTRKIRMHFRALDRTLLALLAWTGLAPASAVMAAK